MAPFTRPSSGDNSGAKLPQEAEFVAWVASAYEARPEFERRAREAAARLSAPQIRNLPHYFYYGENKHLKPAELQDRFNGLGEWMSMCQAAIFEMFYHRPEVALPILNDIAFGEYDWTQIQATDILCRLARDGVIDRERTLRKIVSAWPTWRDTAQDAAIFSLSLVIPTIPEVIDLIKQAISDIDGPPRAYIALHRVAPEEALGYRADLIAQMNGSGQPARTPDEGASHRQIQAAIDLSIMYPDEAEFSDWLLAWAQNHPDEVTRQALRHALRNLSHITLPEDMS
jgi:hypothetical protein